MSTQQLDRLQPAATPGRVGQGTAVEQSRAVAEVQAQVIVAQQMPRNIDRAVREMQRSCSMKSLADRAFYRFSRGGQQVSGPTIQLARELARAWGNVDFGIAELRRDDAYGQSEMLAFAWDLETNARTRTTFIVQHVRDTRIGSKVLTDQRDIYELNANNGARRLREMIFAILPGWYVEDAIDACNATLTNDKSDGATLAERSANAAARFGRIGVTVAQLTQKLGAPQANWSAADLATLAVIFKSIERGESTKDDEFGATAATIAAADLAPPKNVPPADGQALPPSPADAPGLTPPGPAGGTPAKERQAGTGQVGVIVKHLERLGYSEDDRDGRLRVTARLANLDPDEFDSSKSLTPAQAALVIRRVKDLPDAAALAGLLLDLDDPRGEDGAVPGGE